MFVEGEVGLVASSPRTSFLSHCSLDDGLWKVSSGLKMTLCEDSCVFPSTEGLFIRSSGEWLSGKNGSDGVVGSLISLNAPLGEGVRMGFSSPKCG